MDRRQKCKPGGKDFFFLFSKLQLLSPSPSSPHQNMIIRNRWGLACGDLPALSLPFATQAIQHFLAKPCAWCVFRIPEAFVIVLAKPCAWCVFRIPEAFVIVYGKVGLKKL